jgi:hypothetical protein
MKMDFLVLLHYHCAKNHGSLMWRICCCEMWYAGLCGGLMLQNDPNEIAICLEQQD